MSTLALNGQLPNGPCRACDKGAVKRGKVNCRGSEPLNGEDAAYEFTRKLLPSVRAALLNPKPAPEVVVPTGAAAERAQEIIDRRLSPANTDQEPSTVCPRCHEDAGYHKNRCKFCGVKQGRRLRAVRTYGIS